MVINEIRSRNLAPDGPTDEVRPNQEFGATASDSSAD